MDRNTNLQFKSPLTFHTWEWPWMSPRTPVRIHPCHQNIVYFNCKTCCFLVLKALKAVIYTGAMKEKSCRAETGSRLCLDAWHLSVWWQLWFRAVSAEYLNQSCRSRLKCTYRTKITCISPVYNVFCTTFLNILLHIKIYTFLFLKKMDSSKTQK